MILIADGGSTKTSWCLIDKNDQKTLFNTEGYNPYFSDTTYIYNSLRKSLPKDLPLEEIEEVNYYGAGVHSDEKAKVISDAFEQVFINAKVDIGHDLLAAARALLGNNSGFAAILGTGTNTCIYNGDEIVEHIDSLAFILGDEGSGCHIGKKLLGDYIRGYMPEDVRKEFWETFKLTEEEILDSVYVKPLPNRFCASFSKFAYDVQVNKTYTRNLVKSSFTEFFENLVSKYPNYKEYTFNCIGSVAYNFKDILEEVATEYNMTLGNIVRSPIDSLVKFHQERFLSLK